MTGQDLLDRMELLNAELQLQSGEANATKGLLALNVAQDFFEAEVAKRKGALGGSTGTVVTTLNTETTSFPSGVLRIDRLQLLDSNSRPKADLDSLQRTGGHRFTGSWPYLTLLGTSTGEPSAYWTNGTSIYWSPLPSGTHTVRWYGFQTASNITASGTFAYPDIVAFPLATLAVHLYKIGVEDAVQDIAGLVTETFSSALDTLDSFNQDGATGLDYTQVHYT